MDHGPAGRRRDARRRRFYDIKCNVLVSDAVHGELTRTRVVSTRTHTSTHTHTYNSMACEYEYEYIT